MLLLIDCFTKFLFYSILKSKKKSEILKALKKIIAKSGSFDSIKSDNELSFCKEILKPENIFFETVPKGKHASIVESAQRTLKQRVFSYLRLNHTKNWPKIIKGRI